MNKKSVLVCGAGSIGIYLGAKLYSKGHNVKLFGRRKLRGIENEIFIGNKKFPVPEKIFKIPKNEKHDFIFITTKLYDLDYMINLIKKSNLKGTTLIGIQNGLVNISKYEKILKRKIIPVVVFSGFNLFGNKINVTPTPTGWKTENSKEGKIISNLLHNAGIPCTSDRKFDSLRAEKTIVNCCLNALSAVENKPFCDLFKQKKTKKRIDNLFEECYNILKKEYTLEESEKIKRRMHNHWSKLKHYSSTCQDLHSERPTEAKYFNGFIISLGKKYKIPTENNKIILKEIEKLQKIRFK